MANKKDDNLINSQKENIEAFDESKFNDSEFVVLNGDFDEKHISKTEKELSEKILTDSTEKVLENRTSKSRIINICFFIVSIFILVGTLIYQRNEFGISDITESMTDLRYRFLIFIAVVFVLVICCCLKRHDYIDHSLVINRLLFVDIMTVLPRSLLVANLSKFST